MTSDQYFDMRNIATANREPNKCPIVACTATLQTVPSQWGEMPYCPEHCIRIHPGSRTFVYHNGSSTVQKRSAALRNIVFEREYFNEHILGNAAKAETHRICHETSEDALTWNVFSTIARKGLLSDLLSSLTQVDVTSEPELYLWGLKVGLVDNSAPSPFAPLDSARQSFEKGIAKFVTEPDVMMYVPGQLLVLIEAKFTSGNTIAPFEANDLPGEKPRSRDGILSRYSSDALPDGTLLKPQSQGSFYSQLYRNIVFASFMAKHLNVDWSVVNLVGGKQFESRKNKAEFQDPSPFIHSILPHTSHNRFRFHSWERLYEDQIVKNKQLTELAQYLSNKSANCAMAFSI